MPTLTFHHSENLSHFRQTVCFKDISVHLRYLFNHVDTTFNLLDIYKFRGRLIVNLMKTSNCPKTCAFQLLFKNVSQFLIKLHLFHKCVLSGNPMTTFSRLWVLCLKCKLYNRAISKVKKWVINWYFIVGLHDSSVLS